MLFKPFFIALLRRKRVVSSSLELHQNYSLALQRHTVQTAVLQTLTLDQTTTQQQKYLLNIFCCRLCRLIVSALSRNHKQRLFAGVSLRVEPTLQLGEGLTHPSEIYSLSAQPSRETLEESMTRLERGLVTGTLLLHFEVGACEYFTACLSWHVCALLIIVIRACACVFCYSQKLYKKKEGMSVCCAKQSENMDKNRYKDVLPCKFYCFPYNFFTC